MRFEGNFLRGDYHLEVPESVLNKLTTEEQNAILEEVDELDHHSHQHGYLQCMFCFGVTLLVGGLLIDKVPILHNWFYGN